MMEEPARPAAAKASPRLAEFAGGFPRLFLVWFLAGLLLGIVGFSPRARAAGALLWPRADRSQPAAAPVPRLQPPEPEAPREGGAGRPAQSG